MIGRKSGNLRSGNASLRRLESLSLECLSVLVFGEGYILSLFNSILNTICGVVSDYLQCVHESVFNDSGRVAADACGKNLNALLVFMGSVQMIPGSAISGRSPGCGIQLAFVPKTGAVSIYSMHTESLSRSRISMNHFLDQVDGLSRSPLQNNRAGIYEKGDRNQ